MTMPAAYSVVMHKVMPIPDVYEAIRIQIGDLSQKFAGCPILGFRVTIPSLRVKSVIGVVTIPSVLVNSVY